jgi:hypothetical protein
MGLENRGSHSFRGREGVRAAAFYRKFKIRGIFVNFYHFWVRIHILIQIMLKNADLNLASDSNTGSGSVFQMQIQICQLI